jgi:hypothetical protein
VWSHQPAVLSAAVALAWLTEASPNEATTIASAGQGNSLTSSGRDDLTFPCRDRANASPTARGRCDAIVEVVGMMCRSGWPKTLCLPPAIGSSVEATTPRSTSRAGSTIASASVGDPAWARAARAQ